MTLEEIIKEGNEIRLLRNTDLYQKVITADLVSGLMFCAAYNRARFFKYFKHQLNQKSRKGWTAMMFAADFGHVQMVKLLIKEANQRDNVGFTALMRAAMRNHCDVI